MRYLHYLFRDFFIVSFSFLFLLLIIEDLRPNFVSVWLDLRVIFYLVAGSGLITLIASQIKEKTVK